MMQNPLDSFGFRFRGAALIVASLVTHSVWAQHYDFSLVNDGAVIVADVGERDTAFPSVIKVPDWLAPEDRPDPNANYYLYYGNHGGTAIKMRWASAIDGTWTDFDFTQGTGPEPSRGVFDVDEDHNDDSRNDYDHIHAPDLVVDNVNQQFIMYFHGERFGTGPAPTIHERFVATSGTGLNFNDPVTGNGEAGHGPVEFTHQGVNRDVWIGEDYMQVFEKDGQFYGVGKRGIINAAPALDPGDPISDLWLPDASDPFGEAWDREDTPEANWASYTFDPVTNDSQDDYHSPGASFLASQEFADHPNNPEGRRVFSNGNDERLNHVAVHLLPDDLLEVFFYVREANSSEPDDFNSIYRLLYDVSDDDFQNWTVARDAAGQAIFDVVLTPDAFTAAVEEAVGPGYDPSVYADPVSLGDTEIFIDDDGSKYLFFSYVSDAFGGAQGEGQITAVRLTVAGTLIGDYSGDGFVSQADLDLVLLNWGDDTLPAVFDATAISGSGVFDGLISQNELDAVLLNWGDGNAPPQLSAIPEPASIAIIALSAVVIASRQRRHA